MPVQCTRKNVKILGCRNVLTAPYHMRRDTDTVVVMPSKQRTLDNLRH